MKLAKITSVFALLFLTSVVNSQNFNSEKTAWIKYVQRMYKKTPFDGVKVLENADNTFLISVLTLDPQKYRKNQSIMYRVATVKAQEQASRYLNSSKITSSDIIITKEDSCRDASTVIVEEIKSNSIGYVKGLELVNSFPDDLGNMVFIFASRIK